MSTLPDGTVTFLFSDIEVSTSLWQKFPSAMPGALARHHAILNQAIVSHNGYVFQIIGDAFCAAFATASEGLAAALDAQRALRDAIWDETGPIHVRMALHTGTAEVRAGEFTSGEYVSGITLSRAARLMSAGHGGQILLSAPTTELVREQLPPHTALRDMGAHRLKDLVQPQQIFQVVAIDLPQEFPPLKTLDLLPNNLPLQLTSFVGRENELREIRELCQHSRLLTLTGVGGIGKTRLAIQIAAEVIDDFDKGVWFADLAAITDPALVPNAVIHALAVRDEGGRTPLDSLTSFLGGKPLFLVLDNCEHLNEACARLAHHLLTRCPDLKILATSREGLGIAGEVTYQVSSLALPDPRSLPSLETLSDYDAVRLFTERAMALHPLFNLSGANAAAVAQICYRLDGIPLAIELAAARIKIFSPQEIAARLDDRFRLLTGGNRAALPRQSTLRATVDWSYDLLAASERLLFQRLAVFSGGWTFGAAERVCVGSGLDRGDLLELLGHLVDKSLVISEERGEETRYRLLETIREYASEKLRDSGEAEQIHAQHLNYYAQLAAEAEPHLVSALQLVWLSRLDMELDNFRAAMEWSLETRDAESGLRIACALLHFWGTRGYFSEGRDWLEKLLALAGTDELTVRSAWGLYGAGFLAELQDDHTGAETYVQAALAGFRELDDRRGIAYAQLLIGYIRTWTNAPMDARECIEAGLRIFTELGDSFGKAESLQSLGALERRRGNFPQASVLLKEALGLARSRKDNLSAAWTLLELGRIAAMQGYYDDARPFLEEGLELSQAANSRPCLALCQLELGTLSIHQNEHRRAQEMLSEGLQTANAIGNKWDAAWALDAFATLAFRQGSYGRAARLHAASETLLEAYGSKRTDLQRQLQDNTTAMIRKHMNESEFASASAEGRGLTMEEAIEYAIGG